MNWLLALKCNHVDCRIFHGLTSTAAESTKFRKMSPERLTGRWVGDQWSESRRQGQGRRSEQGAGEGQEIRAGGRGRAGDKSRRQGQCRRSEQEAETGQEIRAGGRARDHSRRQGHGSILYQESVAGQEIRAGGWSRAYFFFIYQARESSLVPAGFLTPQFLQKL